MENRRLLVLVVDEDPVQRKACCSLVERAGLDPVEAADGLDALAKARALQPDMIITEWTMSMLGGEELVHAIRSDWRGRQPYIMVASVLTNEEKLAEVIAAGVDDFVRKPLPPELFCARLNTAQRLIRLQRAHDRHIERLSQYSQELNYSNQRLRQLAVTDELTGLPNRRSALDQMEQVWSIATRRQAPLSCMAIEMVGLARINHQYGHERGDVLLKTVAAIMKNLIRAQDIACRIGGDEFLMICPETPLDALVACATRLIGSFNALRNHAERPFFGLNVGAAERRPEVAGPQALLSLASQGVCQAKRYGKNRICAVQDNLLQVVRDAKPKLRAPRRRKESAADDFCTDPGLGAAA